MITIFKRIKSDLKEMYEVLRINPDHERDIKQDMLVAQQMLADSLKKLKRNIALRHKAQKGILDE